MKKILVIDDEREICDLIKTGLERSGDFKVIIATDGKEGLRLTQSEKPDLILLDIRMPEMDGFEVLKNIKETKATAGIPVIMVTALGDEESQTEAMHLYDEGYLVKPVDIKVIKSTIESTLGHR